MTREQYLALSPEERANVSDYEFAALAGDMLACAEVPNVCIEYLAGVPNMLNLLSADRDAVIHSSDDPATELVLRTEIALTYVTQLRGLLAVSGTGATLTEILQDALKALPLEVFWQVATLGVLHLLIEERATAKANKLN